MCAGVAEARLPEGAASKNEAIYFTALYFGAASKAGQTSSQILDAMDASRALAEKTRGTQRGDAAEAFCQKALAGIIAPTHEQSSGGL